MRVPIHVSWSPGGAGGPQTRAGWDAKHGRTFMWILTDARRRVCFYLCVHFQCHRSRTWNWFITAEFKQRRFGNVLHSYLRLRSACAFCIDFLVVCFNLNLVCFLKCFKAQNCHPSQTACWRLGPEHKGMKRSFRPTSLSRSAQRSPPHSCLPGRCRVQSSCCHIKSIQRPRR